MRWFNCCRTTVAGALLFAPLAGLRADEPAPLEFVSPTAAVKLSPGELKLLRARSRIVRLATSNAEVCRAVSQDGQTLAIWGRASGTSEVMVWLADRSSSPVVWIVDVK